MSVSQLAILIIYLIMINPFLLIKNRHCRIFLMLLFGLFLSVRGFADSLDSLRTILGKVKNDSVRISVLRQITEICDEDEINNYANQSLSILENAFDNHKISLRYYTIEKARAFYNIGVYHFLFTNNYIETIDNILKTLKLIDGKPNPTMDEEDLLASSYNTIATAYMRIGKHELGEKYLLKSVVIDKKLDNMANLANDYNNLAGAYYLLENFDKAIFYYNEAITLERKESDTSMLAVRYCNIARMYLMNRNLVKVQEYLNLASNNINGNDDSPSLFEYNKIQFKLFILTGKLKEAGQIIPHIKKTKHINDFEYADYLGYLHDYYVAIGDYKSALEAYKQHTTVQDAAVNENIKVKSEVKQLTFDFEKKQLEEKSENELILTKEQEKRKKQTFISIAIFLICLIVIVFSIIFYKRLKLTQHQNKIIKQQRSEIQTQHQLLEVKTKAVTDSINYSKSIQSTLLSHYNHLKTEKSFIIYEPKDIIGGDFYWTQKNNDNMLVIVGDCTGHGVPGALISVLAIEALNKIYATMNDYSDLHGLIKNLRKEFNKYYESDSLVSIGIDLSIIYFDKEHNKIILSGSGSSIISFNNNVMTRYKFDSYNIGGKLPAICNDQTEELEMSEQVFYMFTDGVIDMKGGELNKKFSMKNLETLLQLTHSLQFTDQKKKIGDTFNNWNQNSDKIDDITFIGISV